MADCKAEKNLKSKLASEIVDAINYVFAIAGMGNIDLNNAVLEKDKNASIKYHHKLNFRTI
ncbi:MAG: hypothetical protein J6Y70_01020 [Bacilli bacterium]|nr:hypothetical protein [Bacilli bacterium]